MLLRSIALRGFATVSAAYLVLVLAGCGSQLIPAAPPAAIPASLQSASIQPPDAAASPSAGDDLQNLPRVPASSLLPISQTTEATYHRVRAGESLSSIARQYGVPVGRLLDANGLESNDDAIQPDQLIYIPKGP